MKINGTPQPGKFPMKKIGGSGGRSGCLPALVSIALLGTLWMSALFTSWRSAT